MTDKSIRIRIKKAQPLDDDETFVPVRPEVRDMHRLRDKDTRWIGTMALVSVLATLAGILLFFALGSRDAPQTMVADLKPLGQPRDGSESAPRSAAHPASADIDADKGTTNFIEQVKWASRTIGQAGSANHQRQRLAAVDEEAATDYQNMNKGSDPQTRSNAQASGESEQTEHDSETASVQTDALASTASAIKGTSASATGHRGSDFSSIDYSTDNSVMPSAKLARAQFTNGIQHREPIDRIETSVVGEGQGAKRLFYFTELRDLKDETVTHRWEHEGKVMAEVRFNVGGDRWRVYSSKTITPTMKGKWRVVVTDAQGQVLSADSIVYEGS